MMRILFITPGYPGLPQVASGSGIGTYVQEMARGLQERGDDCQVLTWSKHGDAGSSEIDGVRVHFHGRRIWPVLERWAPDGRNVSVRAQAARRLDHMNRFDWIEIQGDEGVDIGVQQAFPHKTVLRVHTTLKQMVAVKRTAIIPRVQAYLQREQAAFRLARRVVTHSDAHAAELRQLHPELCRPAIVPHGVGLASERSPITLRPSGCTRFLVVGTLDLRKGTDRLAGVIQAYARAFGPVELRIVSSSPERRLLDFGLVPGQLNAVTVSYASQLTESELAHEFQSATALLHLARYESFGLPLIEAASWGLPVIASPTGIATELLAGELSHFLVDGDRQGECVRAMRSAAAERQAASAAVFARYAECFTRTSMVTAYLDVLARWGDGELDVNDPSNERVQVVA